MANHNNSKNGTQIKSQAKVWPEDEEVIVLTQRRTHIPSSPISNHGLPTWFNNFSPQDASFVSEQHTTESEQSEILLLTKLSTDKQDELHSHSERIWVENNQYIQSKRSWIENNHYSHSNSTDITGDGELAAEQVSGELAAEQVSGELAAEHVGGELAAEHVGGELAAEHVGGELAAEQVSGELAAEQVSGELVDEELSFVDQGQQKSGASAVSDVILTPDNTAISDVTSIQLHNRLSESSVNRLVDGCSVGRCGYQKDPCKHELTSETELLLYELLGEETHIGLEEKLESSSTAVSDESQDELLLNAEPVGIEHLFVDEHNGNECMIIEGADGDKNWLNEPLTSFPVEDISSQSDSGYQATYAQEVRQQHRSLQAIKSILAELTQHCARACCFIYRDGLLIGLAAMGKGKIQDRISDLLFPVETQSTIFRTLQKREAYVGHLPDTAMDQIFAACLGGALPQKIALYPIIQDDGVSGFFYLDDGGEDNFPQDAQVLLPIIEQAVLVNFIWNPPDIEELLAPLASL
jgi:hypothetical protein